MIAYNISNSMMVIGYNHLLRIPSDLYYSLTLKVNVSNHFISL